MATKRAPVKRLPGEPVAATRPELIKAGLLKPDPRNPPWPAKGKVFLGGDVDGPTAQGYFEEGQVIHHFVDLKDKQGNKMGQTLVAWTVPPTLRMDLDAVKEASRITRHPSIWDKDVVGLREQSPFKSRQAR